METVILSAKYQVVIPKSLRKGMGLKPGQKLVLTKGRSGDIVLKTQSIIDRYEGIAKGAWGKDSTGHISQQRDAWKR